MERSDVEEYVERSASIIESSPQMNEENTKAKIIRPLIELLGWDVYSSDVDLEYPMKIGSGSKRADYALLLEGTPVVFIEAKGCDTTLSDTERSQLKSYMRQTGVDWGLLTNGSTFEVLKRRTDTRRPDEVTMGTPSLEELPKQYELLQLLSKDLVESGEADKIAKRMEVTRKAVNHLGNNKEAIAQRVTELVVGEIGDVPPQEVQEVSKEYVDDLIETLEADYSADEWTERTDKLNTGDSERTTKSERANTTRKQPENERYVATLSNSGEQLQSFSAEKQSLMMRDVIDFLITEYDLIDEIGPLPYVPGSKNAVINTEPVHPTGEEMRSYWELSDGSFLDTNMSFPRKRQTIRSFVDSCGLAVEFDNQ